METYATYDRATVFRDHPLIVRDLMLTAEEEATFEPGSVLMGSDGVAALADDTVTADTLIGVLADRVTLGPAAAVVAPVVLHGDAVLEKLVLAEGATAATVAAVLKAAGVNAY